LFFDKFCIFACLNNVDMKKVSILLSMLFVLSLCSFGQDATTNGPEITFKETLHDFGKITFNGNGTCEFVFVNTGNEPLILSQPRSSCGCAVPEWPKRPILPGESDCVRVTYKNTNRPGSFNKYITVFSNAKVNNEVKLHIKGTVLEKAKDAAPQKDNSSSGSPFNSASSRN